MNDDLQGWFDFTRSESNQNDHTKWAQVNVTDISHPFIQMKDKVYWLIVDVWGGGNIGWKESGSPHFRANAVCYDGLNWNELRDPLTQDPLDFAFVIDGSNLVKPLASHTKWSQPPVEVDPNSDIPTYCGWDERSYKSDLETYWKTAADDFRCLGNMPVTSIRWWGSYYGWEWSSAYGTLPSLLPDAWWIGFWSNVPTNAPPHYWAYSYPDELLHSITIPAYRVNFNEVGSDEYYEYYPYDICYQYDVELEPNEVFWQGDYNDVTEDNIYWLSIVALYNIDIYPQYLWGWKTRPWHWMDDTVTFQTAVIIQQTQMSVLKPIPTSSPG